MPHIGPTELIIILIIVIAVFGVGKLPEIGGALGRGVREFREATREVEKASDEVKAVAKDVQESTRTSKT